MLPIWIQFAFASVSGYLAHRPQTAYMSASYDYLFKLISLGDASVGKTSLITRFVFDKYYPAPVLGSIGADFATHSLSIDNQQLQLQLWDTYASARTGFMPHFDVSDRIGRLANQDTQKEISYCNALGWVEKSTT